ncbi:UDP-N-acetylmuramoyl-L-alanyl-D-glutamate--2,6-diaminopimelate ligase [bioreactor metagenome]|uniref:UDP-N-acetylmuramoyl-L-alanyl-D-glutamate--2, 6-diaminopimelate ligase n=1 Tax=bioreactor metagenome TaxID=1076179 RepID=A0A644VLL5_9ZZZZ
MTIFVLIKYPRDMFDIDIYNKEIEWIFNKFPSYQRVGNRAYKPGLETMSEFDSNLGHPHKKYMIVHIAGTNGKGSVSHMIASVFATVGLKTGLYTSPHLLDFRERIKINGEMISKEAVLEFLIKWKPFMEERSPSFFEITTAMAFDFFAREGVDIAVIETGLGGRLDSTNIVSPELSIITNIALDHCEYLGYTLPEIAAEKGGIVKAGVPFVVGEVLNNTRPVFDKISVDKGSPLFYAQESRFKGVMPGEYEIDLKGDYQIHNIRTVLTALNVLGHNTRFTAKCGAGWSDKNIKEGIKCAAGNTGLRGRWERLSDSPEIICDTGHNANGLRIVFSQLRKQKFKRLFILLGFVAEKELEKILGFMPLHAYYLYSKANTERALDPNTLMTKCKSLGFRGEVHNSVESALMKFKSLHREGDLLFIGGSTFIVADAINFLENNSDFFAK